MIPYMIIYAYFFFIFHACSEWFFDRKMKLLQSERLYIRERIESNERMIASINIRLYEIISFELSHMGEVVEC
jgi:hypothetical protein